MGRTLHYSIKKVSGTFSEKELQKMYDVSITFNSGKLKDVWSCENFFCNPLDFYPNWDKGYRSMGAEKAWDTINEKIENIVKGKQCHRFDAVRQLLKQKDIILFNPDFKKEVRGFVKVQGNEFNSLLVLMALTEISLAIPTAFIELSDEGEFLFCDLRIKNGKALPILESLIKDIERYSHLMLFSRGFQGNILDKLDYNVSDFTHEFMIDANLENGYSDMTRYINNKLRNLKEVEKALIQAGLSGNQLYFYNINQRQSKYWFNPLIFTRPVNVEKYLDYSMCPATLMDGFEGEGFGLSDEDAEAKSYRSIGTMMKMLGINEENKKNLQVLGEKKI